MKIVQIRPPHLPDVATLPWEIQKNHILTLLFTYFRLFTLPHMKTSSNCCSSALAVYLLLFRASYYMHIALVLRLGQLQKSGTHVDLLRLAAAACCDVG